MKESILHWNRDVRMLDLAEHIAQWSKDPSTKVGCVIARPDRSIASIGYNGFPRGVADTDERLNNRPQKYAFTVHAEANAIAAARASVENCTLYTHPFPPCATCAGLLIQAGIKRVVTRQPTAEQVERWGDSFLFAKQMYSEVGIEYVHYE